MDDGQRTQIERDGFVLLQHVLNTAEIEALRARLEELWMSEGEHAGEENYIERGARRLANLANKGDLFRPIFANPSVLEAVRAVIGPEVRLSMLNARDAAPHSGASQPLHCDTDHGGKPDARGYYVATALWMLDDFTRTNGATRIVPGSHRTQLLPKEALDDVYAMHPDEVVIEGRAGDVLVFNGHCWHAGGANETDQARRALLAHYIRADHPQRLNPKDALAPEVQARMNPLEREILGLDSK